MNNLHPNLIELVKLAISIIITVAVGLATFERRMHDAEMHVQMIQDDQEREFEKIDKFQDRISDKLDVIHKDIGELKGRLNK